MRLTFLGGTGTVTGSKYLVTTASKRILVDCGLFQGLKQLRLRNWEPPPVDPKTVDAVILTHAHIDHSGYLPLFIRKGFAGPVYCSSATRDLCEILLPDSGHLQEEEAEYANRHGFSKHRPALPLCTHVPVRAEVAVLHNLSAHADYQETLGWLDHFESPPRETFITHGEPVAADALRHRIEEQRGWRCRVPDYLEATDLD